MRLLLAVVVDVSLVILVALAAAAALRRRSAALRHWILTVAIVCALAAPALEVALPTWRLPPATSRWATTIVTPGTLAVFESMAEDSPRGAGTARPTNSSAGLQGPLLTVWGIGASAALLLLLRRLAQLKRLSRRVAPVDDPTWLRILRMASRAHGISRPVDLMRGPIPRSSSRGDSSARASSCRTSRPAGTSRGLASSFHTSSPMCVGTTGPFSSRPPFSSASIGSTRWSGLPRARSAAKRSAHAMTWCSKPASPDPNTPVTCLRSLVPHRRCGPVRRPRRWPGLPRLKRGFAPC